MKGTDARPPTRTGERAGLRSVWQRDSLQPNIVFHCNEKPPAAGCGDAALRSHNRFAVSTRRGKHA